MRRGARPWFTRACCRAEPPKPNWNARRVHLLVAIFWAESEQITLSATGHKGDPKVSLPTLTEGTGHPPTPKRLRRGWSAGALIKYDSHNREPNEPSEAALGCGLGLPRERPRPRFLNGALGLR